MPTASGWLTVILSVATFVVGQILSLEELVFFGVVGFLLVVFSLLAVRLFCPKFSCRRSAAPEIVSAFEAVRVELKFLPLKWRPWTLPVVGTDNIVTLSPNGGEENFQVSFASNSGSVLYDFRPTQRGIINFSSLALRCQDPFALAYRKWTVTDVTELLVLPSLEDVLPPNTALESKTWQEDYCSAWQGTAYGDFHSLREYLPGDDLRRVHWRSSARLGQLVIRQSENQWEVGVSVVLDNRWGAASLDEFERMVGACASIIGACRKNSLAVRLYFLASEESEILVEDAQSYKTALLKLAYVAQESQVDFSIRPAGMVILLTGSEEDSYAGGLDSPPQPGEDFREYSWQQQNSDLSEDSFKTDWLTSLCFRTEQATGLIVSFGGEGFAQVSPGPNISRLWVSPQQSFGELWDSHFGISSLQKQRLPRR